MHREHAGHFLHISHAQQTIKTMIRQKFNEKDPKLLKLLQLAWI